MRVQRICGGPDEQVGIVCFRDELAVPRHNQLLDFSQAQNVDAERLLWLLLSTCCDNAFAELELSSSVPLEPRRRCGAESYIERARH